VSAFRVGENLISSAKRAGSPLNLQAAKIGKGINIACSLVCTVDKEFFLDVAPDVVWLTYDELSSADIEIRSNVKWIIE
jgi:hypothetical protein